MIAPAITSPKASAARERMSAFQQEPGDTDKCHHDGRQREHPLQASIALVQLLLDPLEAFVVVLVAPLALLGFPLALLSLALGGNLHDGDGLRQRTERDEFVLD